MYKLLQFNFEQFRDCTKVLLNKLILVSSIDQNQQFESIVLLLSELINLCVFKKNDSVVQIISSTLKDHIRNHSDGQGTNIIY